MKCDPLILLTLGAVLLVASFFFQWWILKKAPADVALFCLRREIKVGGIYLFPSTSVAVYVGREKSFQKRGLGNSSCVEVLGVTDSGRLKVCFTREPRWEFEMYRSDLQIRELEETWFLCLFYALPVMLWRRLRMLWSCPEAQQEETEPMAQNGSLPRDGRGST